MTSKSMWPVYTFHLGNQTFIHHNELYIIMLKRTSTLHVIIIGKCVGIGYQKQNNFSLILFIYSVLNY